MIIEIDGGQHNERKVKEKDEKREKWLKEKGYQILRFWNNDVLTNIEGVLEKIKETLEGKAPSPVEGEGKKHPGVMKTRGDRDIQE